MKTNAEVKNMVFSLLKNSPLADEIKGNIYKTNRPMDADTEDIVVAILDSNIEQIQTFIVNINIYTPAVCNGSNIFEPTERIEELSRMAMDFLATQHIDGYRLLIEKQSVFAVNGKTVNGKTVNGKKEYLINNRVRINIYNAD